MSECAQIYQDMHKLVKSVDPSARVAVGGVILLWPLRRHWVETVLDERQEAAALASSEAEPTRPREPR